MSGITVKRAVSSSSRTQAIFSSELRAAVNSRWDDVSGGFHNANGRVSVLEKVRIFFNSVLNRMLEEGGERPRPID